MGHKIRYSKRFFEIGVGEGVFWIARLNNPSITEENRHEWGERIVTAVNVMPEVITFVRDIVNAKAHLRTLTFESRARALLEILEAVDGS